MNNHTPFGSDSHRIGEIKFKYLPQAVIKYSSAIGVLSHCYSSTAHWNFDKFYSSFKDTWKQEQRHTMPKGEKTKF